MSNDPLPPILEVADIDLDTSIGFGFGRYWQEEPYIYLQLSSMYATVDIVEHRKGEKEDRVTLVADSHPPLRCSMRARHGELYPGQQVFLGAYHTNTMLEQMWMELVIDVE